MHGEECGLPEALRGVAALADVGCDLECYVTRVIGSTVQSAARSALAGVTVR